VIPKDWGRLGSPPTYFKLPERRAEVQGRYEELDATPQVKAVFDQAELSGADGVFVESPYVDLAAAPAMIG